MKKILTAAMACVIMFTGVALTACERTKINKNMTQLYVGNYNGGIGFEWIYELAKEFELARKDISYEPGKFGVEIIVDNAKDEYTSNKLTSSIASSRRDLYFTQDLDFRAAAAQGLFADITDIVTEKTEELDLGDGLKQYSIEDKVQPYVLDYFKYDNKFYGLPYATPIYGIIYDVDLFANKSLYFLENGSINGSIDRETDKLSKGPDGKENTFDDGLPSTWEEFKLLMNTMLRRQITPFTWSGQYSYQRNSFIISIWASYEGFDDHVLNWTLQGETSQGVEINFDNAYELVSNEGRHAALIAAKDIVTNTGIGNNFSDYAFGLSQSHIAAEEEFLSSGPIENKPIAMILEGGYWENEAKDIFDDIVAITNDEQHSRENRRFAFMPIPKFVGTAGISDQTHDEQVFVSTLNSLAFINAASTKVELAKEFLQYIHTNENLSKFNAITGVTRGYKYKMSQEDYNSMSYYQKSMYDIVSKNNFNILQTGYQFSPLRLEHENYFRYWGLPSSRINKTEYSEPLQAFYNNPNITPKMWFDSYALNYNAASWVNKQLP